MSLSADRYASTGGSVVPSLTPIHFSVLYTLTSATAAVSSLPSRLSSSRNTVDHHLPPHSPNNNSNNVSYVALRTKEEREERQRRLGADEYGGEEPYRTSSSPVNNAYNNNFNNYNNNRNNSPFLWDENRDERMTFSSAFPPLYYFPEATNHISNNDNNISNDDPLPLTTMDLRELSKVVFRDAIYYQFIHLLNSRQCIETAVWSLSPRVIQFDGAVAVEAANLSPSVALSFPGKDLRFVRSLVVERLCELLVPSYTESAPPSPSSDAASVFFQLLLTPYLGKEGSAGVVTQVLVDGCYVY